MEGFDFGAELHVLRGKNCFTNDDGDLQRLSAVVTRDSERRWSRRIFHRNWQQAESVAIGLRKKLGSSIVEFCRRESRRAGDAKGVAELDLSGSDGTGLRNDRRDKDCPEG